MIAPSLSRGCSFHATALPILGAIVVVMCAIDGAQAVAQSLLDGEFIADALFHDGGNHGRRHLQKISDDDDPFTVDKYGNMVYKDRLRYNPVEYHPIKCVFYAAIGGACSCIGQAMQARYAHTMRASAPGTELDLSKPRQLYETLRNTYFQNPIFTNGLGLDVFGAVCVLYATMVRYPIQESGLMVFSLCRDHRVH